MDNATIACRLLLALFLGALIGFEREQKHQPAGLRTHSVLCLGAALAMVTSVYVADCANALAHVKVSDPARIAAQVVSGIGFLCGGVIFKTGISIRGLTTASSLWATAILGLTVGSGLYLASTLATIFMLITLRQLSHIEKVMIRSKTMRNMLVTTRNEAGVIGTMEAILHKYQANITSFRVVKNEEKFDIVASVEFPPEVSVREVSQEIANISAVISVDLQG